MNIDLIKKAVNEIDEIKIVDKDFFAYGTDYNFAGIYRSGKKLTAVMLSYCEELRDLREQAEIDEINGTAPEHITVRESLKYEIKFGKPTLIIKRIVSGETVLLSHNSEAMLTDNNNPQNAVFLSEFIKKGLSSPRLSFVDFDNLYIHKFNIDGEFERIPPLNENLTLSFRQLSNRTVTEKPISLKIGKCNEKIEIGNDKTIFIREVKLLDMYEETKKSISNEKFLSMCSAEEAKKIYSDFVRNFSPLCPKGKFFAAVEYEAPKNISADFRPLSVLDFPPIPKDSCMAFLIGSDSPVINEGMCAKAFLMDTPFDGETTHIDAELFIVSETVRPDDITI